MTPSQRLRAHLRAQMQRHEPFSRLEPASMEALLDGVRESYHAPGEVILGPQAGAVERLRWVRSGAVRGTGSGGEVSKSRRARCSRWEPCLPSAR